MRSRHHATFQKLQRSGYRLHTDAVAMTFIQLTVTLRFSTSCNTVHLHGSWDNYTCSLPLREMGDYPRTWKGTFRVLLTQRKRYWYYYLIDSSHISYDSLQESTIESSTGYRLNILDVPLIKGEDTTALTRCLRAWPPSIVVKGRSLSPSRIWSPRPQKPHAARCFTERFIHEEPETPAVKRVALLETDLGIYRSAASD